MPPKSILRSSQDRRQSRLRPSTDARPSIVLTNADAERRPSSLRTDNSRRPSSLRTDRTRQQSHIRFSTDRERQPSSVRHSLETTSSSIVSDVVIPARLLSIANDNSQWDPESLTRSSLASDGPVSRVLRSVSIAPTALQIPRTAHLRQPSFPPSIDEVPAPDTHREVKPVFKPTFGHKATDSSSSAGTNNTFGSFSWKDGSGSDKSSDDHLDEPDPMTMGGGLLPSRTPPRRLSFHPNVFADSSSAHGHPPTGRRGTIHRVVEATRNAVDTVRRSSIFDLYESAKVRGAELQRQPWAQLAFEYGFYAFLIAFVYLVLIGLPLWKGAVYWLYWVAAHKFTIRAGFTITLGIAIFYAYTPLFVLYEQDPPTPETPPDWVNDKIPDHVLNTALLIPCYKSASLIANTLDAALKVFPPQNIIVIANGNSPTPLDNTEEVCRPYGVTHVWSPVGSKIVAQFVGCYAAKAFKDVLLIDDDCALPPNFPIVSDRLKGKVQCIGYTIKSVGPGSSKGTYCQQAQDLEYKLSGIQRALAGKIGSATFPHGAISLWDREFLIKTFHDHPGFSVSEDWFFGHSCRRLGGRITMCTAIFVETETPPAVFFSSGGARGGFGEMTIFKQRFLRWNFFFVNGMWYDFHYILGSWKLGFWELGAKIFVFQEIYETLLYLLTPFIMPISLILRPSFCGILLAATFGLYLINVIIFNEVHLRLKKERINTKVLLWYYMPYKIILTFVNVASCYWSLYKYARYFAKRHPKVIEDEKAVEVVLRLEEPAEGQENVPETGRRMTVTAIHTRFPSVSSGGAPELYPISSGSSETSSSSSRSNSAEIAIDPRALGVDAVDFAVTSGPRQPRKSEAYMMQDLPGKDRRKSSYASSGRKASYASFPSSRRKASMASSMV